MTPIGRLAQFLRSAGVDAQLEGETVMLNFDESEVARGEVYLELEESGSHWRVQGEAAMSLLVGEEALGEVLMGLNLINSSLPVGSLYLEALSDEENPFDEGVAFTLWGRFSALVASLEPEDLTLLQETLEEFLGGVSEALEGSMDMRQTLKA
ncbi:MAG: hypothetical protein H7095_01095 [Pseudopedobacter sp.]|nr:hypothetical protein [Deinococcales bacterium]